MYKSNPNFNLIQNNVIITAYTLLEQTMNRDYVVSQGQRYSAPNSASSYAFRSVDDAI